MSLVDKVLNKIAVMLDPSLGKVDTRVEAAESGTPTAPPTAHSPSPAARPKAEQQTPSVPGIETLLLCMRNDNLDPDGTLKEATAELKSQGPDGSQALAQLIRELMRSRSRGIGWALLAAQRVEATPELLEAVRAVLNASPLGKSSSGRFEPEIVGEGRIGWTDSTYKRIQGHATTARDALESALATKPAARATPPVRPSEVVQPVSGAGTPPAKERKDRTMSEETAPKCSRCGAKATHQFGRSPRQDPVCNTCRNASGVCISCGRQVGSDAGLSKLRNCPACERYYDGEIDRLRRPWG